MKITVDFSLLSWQQGQDVLSQLRLVGVGANHDPEKHTNFRQDVTPAQWEQVQQIQAKYPSERKFAWESSY